LYSILGGNWKKISEQVGKPMESVKNRFYNSLKKRIPEALRSVPSQQPRKFKAPIIPSIKEFCPDVDSFFAFDDDEMSQSTRSAEADEMPDISVLTASEKKMKLQSLIGKMARLEAFLNHTKTEISNIDYKCKLHKQFGERKQ
jgi:hypothetical protein